MRDHKSSRAVLATASALLLLAAGAGVGWAVLTLTTPPRQAEASQPYTTVKVVSGTVGSTIALNVVATWTAAVIGSNMAAGTVTGVTASPGATVAQGSQLYSVDLRPVVVAMGQVPAFRSLQQGEHGADIGQLQSLLSDLGFYKNAVDGSFGGTTTIAVKLWQKSLGLDPDGVVQTGDIIFVPTLPTAVTLDTKLVFRGAKLAGGEQVVDGLPSEPNFSIPVSAEQASIIPTNSEVRISAPNNATWDASTGAQSTDSSGQTSIQLKPSTKDSICGATCSMIPVVGETLLSSKIVTQPEVSGLVVPTSALASQGNSVFVTDINGRVRVVKVVASAQGMSVITGIPAGILVRLPSGS